MAGEDWFADLYLHFSDDQQWLYDTFGSMTHDQFNGFIGYVFTELDDAVAARDALEFVRTRGLMLAIARKELEFAWLEPGLPDEVRQVSDAAAQGYYEVAKSHYEADKVPAVEAAWTASLEIAKTWGAETAVGAIVAQKSVFRMDEQH